MKPEFKKIITEICKLHSIKLHSNHTTEFPGGNVTVELGYRLPIPGRFQIMAQVVCFYDENITVKNAHIYYCDPKFFEKTVKALTDSFIAQIDNSVNQTALLLVHLQKCQRKLKKI